MHNKHTHIYIYKVTNTKTYTYSQIHKDTRTHQFLLEKSAADRKTSDDVRTRVVARSSRELPMIQQRVDDVQLLRTAATVHQCRCVFFAHVVQKSTGPM